MPGDSTVNQLADLYNAFCKALDDRKEVHAKFCDIRKAIPYPIWNDIVEGIRSSIRLFADDPSPYIIVDDPFDAVVTLNSDLSKIQRWAAQWLVTFNPSKSESRLISRKVNKPYHPPLMINYQQVSEDTSHKHLGLYFSNDCKWHDHIQAIKKKT